MNLMDEKTKYWIDISDYDLQTAKAMHETKRYVYVGFMCHQVIEKILKGHCVKVTNQMPPYIHNLNILSKKSGVFDTLSDEHKALLNVLEPLNIEARYPSYKNKIFKLMTGEKSKQILKQTEELQKWLKEKL